MCCFRNCHGVRRVMGAIIFAMQEKYNDTIVSQRSCLSQRQSLSWKSPVLVYPACWGKNGGGLQKESISRVMSWRGGGILTPSVLPQVDPSPEKLQHFLSVCVRSFKSDSLGNLHIIIFNGKGKN